MPEHPHFGDADIVNVETHHEESDVNVRGLLWFVVVFISFAIVMHVALWILFKFYVQLERGNANAPMTQIAVGPDASVPPVPRLQPFPTKEPTGVTASPVASTPVADLDDMRAHEQQVLDHYGWVDQQKGIVHIPIEQAKQLALQHNAFAVNTATAAPVNPLQPVNTRPTAGAPPTSPAAPTQGNPRP